MTTARAGGKVILLGEHAVVYGVPALAAGIERGAGVEATPSDESRLTLPGRQVLAGDDSDLGQAFAALLAAMGAPPLSMTVTLELPAGCGLGASAAMGVALARGAAPYCGEPRQESDVLAAAMAWERVFHGNPSGVDAAASAHGGCIQFTRGVGIEQVTLPRALELVQ